MLVLDRIFKHHILSEDRDEPCLYNSSTSMKSFTSIVLSEELKDKLSQKFNSRIKFGVDIFQLAIYCENVPQYLKSTHTQYIRVTYMFPVSYFYETILERVKLLHTHWTLVIHKHGNVNYRFLLKIGIMTVKGGKTLEARKADLLLFAEYSSRLSRELDDVTVVIDLFNQDFSKGHVNTIKANQKRLIREKKFSEILVKSAIQNSKDGGQVFGVSIGYFEEAFDHNKILKLYREQDNRESFEMKMKLTLDTFTDLLISYDTLQEFITIGKPTQNTSFNSSLFTKPSNMFVIYNDPFLNGSVDVALSNLIHFEKTHKAPSVKAFILNSFVQFNGTTGAFVNEIVNWTRGNSDIKFGITVTVGNTLVRSLHDEILDKILKHLSFCSRMFDPCDVVLLKLVISPFAFNVESRKIQRDNAEESLSYLRRLLPEFTKYFPGLQIIFNFNWYRTEMTLQRSSFIYCDEQADQNFMVINGMMNWAVNNKIPVMIMAAFQNYLVHGWWQKLERSNTTNVATYIPHNELSCITSNDKALESEIKWDPEIAGISMFPQLINDSSWRNVSPKTTQLKLMLRFVLHKFKRIDIIFDLDAFSVNGVSSALTSAETVAKYENMDEEIINVFKLYITVPLPSLFNLMNSNELPSQISELLQTLKTFRNNSANHFTSLEGITFSDLKSASNGTATKALMKQFKDEAFIAVGSLFENCETLLHSELDVSQKLLILQSDYVECDEKYFQPTKIHLLEQYFRRLLIIQRTFNLHFPSKSIIFRVTTSFSAIHQARDETINEKEVDKDYLRFWNEFNGFSNAYQIKFFIHPAFAKKHDEFGGDSWWKINDYSKLANKEVFLERESDFLREETWRPEDDPVETPLPDQDTFFTTVIIGSLIALVALLTFILVAFLIKRRKLVTLSSAEADEFFKGKLNRSDSTDSIALVPLSHYVMLGIDTFLKEKYDSKFEIPKGEIDFGTKKVIGTGNFGIVYKAVWNGINVAVKKPNGGFNREAFKSMLDEVKVMSFMGEHVNVLTFLGACTSSITEGKLLIITELCDNGNLLSVLQTIANKSSISSCVEKDDEIQSINPDGTSTTTKTTKINQSDQYELLRFSQEIACGMEYISSKNVVHGDLATRNILLDNSLTCKISDFGLSRKLYERTEYIKKKEEQMPWRWMAIETLKRMEFSTKSDVWSYGVTLWEIFTLGSHPYPGLEWSCNFTDELAAGMRMSQPEFATETIYAEILKTWNEEPAERPTFTELAESFQHLRISDYDRITN
ncbi:unnamed protein product [Orchesella dallaii]|uniref:Protein kinase domain-containing protein n=1 Tax=Orchesella dallaii TaxID=48710 RepID=A0ABP1R2H9_9HEXA